jgi:hypothetical protein
MASRRGEIEVAVRLTGKPLAAVAGSKQGKKWSRSKQNPTSPAQPRRTPS